MALLTAQEIEGALKRLGELALAEDTAVELLAVGGVVMVLDFRARLSTRDVDAVVLDPGQTRMVRELARIVAEELEWPEDWLNDAAKGYLVGFSVGPVIFSAPGILVRSPEGAQLLAMKLSAWRDDVDIGDASRLLLRLAGDHQRRAEEIWERVEKYLVRGQELKARYAFLDLWETLYGDA